VRVIRRGPDSCLVLGLLTALLCIAPNAPACARTRAFQMALWGAESDSTVGLNTDVAVFPEGHEQPKGDSVMINFNWQAPLSQHGDYEWSRILAVLVDEPYNDFNGVTCWTNSIAEDVRDRTRLLSDRARELKSVSPLTRFWVNYAEPQLKWMTTRQCTHDGSGPPSINNSDFDVVSVDVYRASFKRGVKKYYDWLVLRRSKPDQQVALIPGTFHIRGKDKPAVQASYLKGYFDYANRMNRNCNLPLGSRGQTGSFDGCPVWMVMGWLSHNHTEGGLEYVGERDPRSAAIARVWRAQVAVPLRSDLANQRQRSELAQTSLPPLLQ